MPTKQTTKVQAKAWSPAPTREVEPRQARDRPQVDELLAKAKETQHAAQRVRQRRHHICAVCGDKSCLHWDRYDGDTGELFRITEPGYKNEGGLPNPNFKPIPKGEKIA